MGHIKLIKNKTLCLSTLSISCLGLLSFSAYADEAKGLNWLKAQAQNQSQNQVTASSIANGLQALSETSHTLNQLANIHTSFDVTELTKQEFSTEGLVRFALLSHHQKNTALPLASFFNQLKDYQNDDGGFGHIQHWQSNALDTAYVLIALAETNYISSLNTNQQAEWQGIINGALNYLA